MSQVKKYKAEIISVINPIDNIYTVELKSLNGKFKYLPGQFLHLALDEYDPSLGWPESRCFSMQSSPSNEFIKITFSEKGCFTARMVKELSIGKIIDLKLPYGELFQQEHSKEKVVFIAGGTGITPFLSAFNDPSFAEYNSPILYLGVRKQNYNLYDKELALAKKINRTLSVNIKNQELEGILDIDRIFYENGVGSIYFISGPQTMITKFRSRLLELGIQEDSVKTDEWE